MVNTKGTNHGLGKNISAEWPLLLIILGSLLAGMVIYPQLPEQVASHWNYKGEVDAYSSRFWGAFGIPLMTAGIYALMLVLPIIDPRRQNYEKFTGVYRLFKGLMVLFMTGLYLVVILNAIGYRVPVDRVTMAGISILFMIIGNYMGQVRHNYFVGIKTPWTLASERVWQKTHRLGGRLWVVAGITGLAASWIGGAGGGILLAASLGLAVIVPVVYSYLEYRKVEN